MNTYEIGVLTKLVDVRSNEHNIVQPNQRILFFINIKLKSLPFLDKVGHL